METRGPFPSRRYGLRSLAAAPAAVFFALLTDASARALRAEGGFEF